MSCGNGANCNEVVRRRGTLIILSVTAIIFLILSAVSFLKSRNQVTPDTVQFESSGAVQGKRVFQSYNCTGCHTIVGNGAYFGPDLTATGWSRYLMGYETGIWLLAMWIFGAIITLGLLSFNLERVQAGDATLPYLMAGVEYPGLLLVTLLFVWRFLSSLEARGPAPALAPNVAPALSAATSG